MFTREYISTKPNVRHLKIGVFQGIVSHQKALGMAVKIVMFAHDFGIAPTFGGSTRALLSFRL